MIKVDESQYRKNVQNSKLVFSKLNEYDKIKQKLLISTKNNRILCLSKRETDFLKRQTKILFAKENVISKNEGRNSNGKMGRESYSGRKY